MSFLSLYYSYRFFKQVLEIKISIPLSEGTIEYSAHKFAIHIVLLCDCLHCLSAMLLKHFFKGGVAQKHIFWRTNQLIKY